MPDRPDRPCLTQGCPNVGTKEGRGYCQPCARRRDQRRGSRQERGYSERWLRASERFRAQHPICGERQDGELYPEHSRCVRENIVTQATEVDHIVAHRGNKALFWNRANWQSLCHPCHSTKTAREGGGFGKRGFR